MARLLTTEETFSRLGALVEVLEAGSRAPIFLFSDGLRRFDLTSSHEWIEVLEYFRRVIDDESIKIAEIEPILASFLRLMNTHGSRKQLVKITKYPFVSQIRARVFVDMIGKVLKNRESSESSQKSGDKTGTQ